MKFSQLVLGFILLYLSILGLYAAFTSEQKEWLIILSGFFLLFLAIRYILIDFTNYSKYIKDNILNSDAEARIFFRVVIALMIMGFSIFILYKFFNGFGFLASILLIILALTYAFRSPVPGIYKNGKFLGKVYKASLKVNKNNITTNKPTNTEEAVILKIVKNGQEVAELHLTQEGVMELTPDKIKEVFPDIDGKIERFNNIFKVGDYSLYYEFLKPETTYYYKENKKDTTTDPGYSHLTYNIWHRD